MRAMILAAGLGTRLRPLTNYRAKPALPVCGRPVISLLLELLARHGVEETLINLHHLPQSIRHAVEGDHPAEMKISWSEEKAPLGTGGGIRRAADFLRGSDDCLVLAGDMLLDIDLTRLHQLHRESRCDATLVLRSDARAADFGTIGVTSDGQLARIGKRRLDLKPTSGDRADGLTPDRIEVSQGLFTGVRFFSRDCLTDWPASETFEDLRDWLAPRIERGEIRVGAEVLAPEDSVWEPVGTPGEYLAVNLHPPALPSLGGDVRHWGGALQSGFGTGKASVVSASARIPAEAELEGCVVWEGEEIPTGFHGRDGVYAGGAFHPFGLEASGSLQ